MLTDKNVRDAKPREKPYKVADGAGMYLLVNPDGARYWRLKYRFAGREKLLALGTYPAVTIKDARRHRDVAKAALRDGRDPSAEKQAKKRAEKIAGANTFDAVAREWHAKARNTWDSRHADRVWISIENNLLPDLGTRPIAEIDAPEMLAVLRKIESRGAHETRMRAQQRAGAVFRYAVATGRAERDPSADLRGAFTAPRVTHYAAVSRKDLPELLKKIDGYDGEPTTRLALKLLILTFVRTGELRGAEWSEIDTEAAEWRIPAERMKMREPHVVPLSKQSLAVIEELRALSGSGRYVFPHRTRDGRTMSENTVLYALYRLGYESRMTGHGVRAVASTILNETGFAPDVVERQLAHVERNRTRASYNRWSYLPERRAMMQQWGDMLAALGQGAQVIPLQRRA
ncbi:MAG: integrase arm-type DNA-binding domain-containing protein [Casimicrobiaceae bacterium]